MDGLTYLIHSYSTKPTDSATARSLNKKKGEAVINVTNWSRSVAHNLAIAAVGSCCLSNAWAAPMVYTGIVVTDVRIDRKLMHNATLTITFEGDTADITPVLDPAAGTPITSAYCTGPSFFYITKGATQMRIEYHGRAQVANVANNQIFVALDSCSGGMGFGSFLGSGLEPAYPLAFTQGTAQFATGVTNPRSGPSVGPGALAQVASTTGVAWSCLGFPPLGDGHLHGTTTGACNSPDNSPIKSNIGNIFVYQPYYETDAGGVAIWSNHDGSTNRGTFLIRRKEN